MLCHFRFALEFEVTEQVPRRATPRVGPDCLQHALERCPLRWTRASIFWKSETPKVQRHPHVVPRARGRCWILDSLG